MKTSARDEVGTGGSGQDAEPVEAGVPVIEVSRDVLGAGLVERPRLIDRLLASHPTPLVVLDGPAGYSKTTTLAIWKSADERPFAWLTCQPRHDHPSLLVAAIVAALEPLRLVGPEVMLALNTPRPDVDTILERLAQAIRAGTEPFVLVIDDAHNLKSPGIAEVLETVLASLPAGSQLVLSTRGRPPLHLGRIRAHRELLEIGAAELAMTHAESETLLSGIGLDLDADQTRRIFEATEGWPAGLYLAGLVLRGQDDDIGAAVAGFSGDDRVVVEYFRDELFNGIPGEEAEFLRRTAVLDELSAPLCDAVLDRTDSALMLGRLMSQNAMIVPLDRAGTRFRYHHLFAAMLRSELRLREPEMEREIHGRASHWYEAAGEVESAVNHAIASGQIDWAGELIWRSVPEMTGRGRIATMDRWMKAIGDKRVESNRELLLTMAHRDLIMGRGLRAANWLRLVTEKGLRERTGDPDARADLHMLRATLALDGIARMSEDATRASELMAEDNPFQSACFLYMGVAQHLGGDPAAAEPLLREAARAGAVVSTIIQSLALAQHGLIAIEDNRPHDAARLVSQAHDQVERCGLSTYGSMALIFAVSAFVRANEGRLSAAREDVNDCLRILAQLEELPTWYEAETRIVLCRTMIRLGDLEAAATVLDEALDFRARTSGAPMLEAWAAEVGGSLATSRQGPLGQAALLTKAELRILEYLPTHYSFKAIGGQVHLSQNTVKTHAASIYRKLGASSRNEAVSLAKEAGLIDPHSG